MLTCYLAARFSRKPELQRHAEELAALGIGVTSRWLDAGAHEWTGTPDHEIPSHVQGLFAAEDLEDVAAADVVVLFTEEPSSSGGMWVEPGYALAAGKPVIIVGPPRNIFCCLTHLTHCATWAEAEQLIVNAATTGSGVRDAAAV